MPKILKIVDACNDCVHYHYYSGGRDKCDLVDEIIQDKTQIASFCLLPDYPSRIIADMDATIRALREPNKYTLVYAVLSHIATKLNTTVRTNGVITIALKDGREILLWHDHIATIDMSYGVVPFIHGNKKYKLHPDNCPPELYEEVVLEGEKEPLWVRLELA